MHESALAGRMVLLSAACAAAGRRADVARSQTRTRGREAGSNCALVR